MDGLPSLMHVFLSFSSLILSSLHLARYRSTIPNPRRRNPPKKKKKPPSHLKITRNAHSTHSLAALFAAAARENVARPLFPAGVGGGNRNRTWKKEKEKKKSARNEREKREKKKRKEKEKRKREKWPQQLSKVEAEINYRLASSRALPSPPLPTQAFP
jgi:hypothetical protein